MDTFTIQDAPLNMAPTGIATFAKVPICYDLRQANADVAILGARLICAFREKPDVDLDRVASVNASTRFRMKKRRKLRSGA